MQAGAVRQSLAVTQPLAGTQSPTLTQSLAGTRRRGVSGGPVRHTARVEPTEAVLQRVTAQLAAAGCVAADEEAAELVAVADDHGDLQWRIGRRRSGEPLAWITGATTFCGRRVAVWPGVFVPRAQSEELARRAVAALGSGPCRAVDLCTGSGAVAAVMAGVPGAAVIGVDRDPRAAACARANGVVAVVGDLAGPLAPGCFDVVTAVAPYVPTAALAYLPADVVRHEPRGALDGGADGLQVVRRVVSAAAGLLRPGGTLLVELGTDQDRLLATTLTEAGLTVEAVWWDDDGDLRGLQAVHTP
jgi:release factor glutamine methyltransferase